MTILFIAHNYRRTKSYDVITPEFPRSWQSNQPTPSYPFHLHYLYFIFILYFFSFLFFNSFFLIQIFIICYFRLQLKNCSFDVKRPFITTFEQRIVISSLTCMIWRKQMNPAILEIMSRLCLHVQKFSQKEFFFYYFLFKLSIKTMFSHDMNIKQNMRYNWIFYVFF